MIPLFLILCTDAPILVEFCDLVCFFVVMYRICDFDESVRRKWCFRLDRADYRWFRFYLCCIFDFLCAVIEICWVLGVDSWWDPSALGSHLFLVDLTMLWCDFIWCRFLVVIRSGTSFRSDGFILWISYLSFEKLEIVKWLLFLVCIVVVLGSDFGFDLVMFHFEAEFFSSNCCNARCFLYIAPIVGFDRVATRIWYHVQSRITIQIIAYKLLVLQFRNCLKDKWWRWSYIFSRTMFETWKGY